MSRQGFAGAKGNGNQAGGGGGAKETGSEPVTGGTKAVSAGGGGSGLSFDISGVSILYAGGGGGGGAKSLQSNTYGTPGAGGLGGGGDGGQETETTDTAAAENGTDGLGGGGGGGSSVSGKEKGGNGGSGVVIIRYGAGGDGDGVVNPTISLTGLTYDDATGDATVTYRVGWAGDGYDRADVSAIWGFHEDDLDNTNSVTTSTIGQGTGSFALPRVSKTVYVRLLATNTGDYIGVSPEVKTLVLFNPAAPIATASASQTLGSGNAGVSKAALEADVTNLGTGATTVNGVFQICHDKFFDEGTYTTFAVTNGPISAAGALRGEATGLLSSTTYWLRAVLTNDVLEAGAPTVYETDPVSFTTGLAGWPAGRFEPSNDNPEFTVTTNSISAAFRFRSLGEGAASGSCWLEVSTTHDVKDGGAYTERFADGFVAGSTTTNQVVAADVPANFDFTVEGLQPDTQYYIRYRVSNNDGRVTSNNDAYEFPFRTLAEPSPASGGILLIY